MRSNFALSRRLALPRILVSRHSAGEGLSPLILLGAWCSRQSCQELPRPISDSELSEDESPDTSFEGFPDPQTSPEALLSAARVRLLSAAASGSLASALSTIVPGSRLRMWSLQLLLNSSGRLLPDSTPVSWDESCRADLR